MQTNTHPELSLIIEAVIFVAEQPVTEEELQSVIVTENLLPTTEGMVLSSLLDELTHKYQSNEYPFHLCKIGGGYRFLTKNAFFPYLKTIAVHKLKKRLSKAALETLSIIAYKQPVTKTEMEFIRGVNCDYAVQKLLDRRLIQITGRADAPGKPLLYATTAYFLEYLGINHVNDLPKLKEFEEQEDLQLERFRQTQENPPTTSLAEPEPHEKNG